MPATRFVELSHPLYDNMPGFKERDREGREVYRTARVEIARTHEESRPYLKDGAQFCATVVSFRTALGTYVDSPFCRYPDKRDIGALPLDDLILPGVLIDAKGMAPGAALGVEAAPPPELAKGAAIVFRFGWEGHHATPAYRTHPYPSMDLLRRLVVDGAKLVAVDTASPDAPGDMAFPAHSHLLANDVLIVENLTNMDALPTGAPFRFFALPLPVQGAGSMPVRAFAEIAA